MLVKDCGVENAILQSSLKESIEHNTAGSYIEVNMLLEVLRR